MFKADKSMLAHELAAIISIAEGKKGFACSGMALLSARNNHLEVYVTDLEISLNTTIPVAVTREQAICVPVKKLHDAVKLQPAGDIAINISNAESFEIEVVGKGKYKLEGLNPGEYYAQNSEEMKLYKGTFKAKDFLTMIPKVMPSVCQDETKYHINGVRFDYQKGRLCLVSTDGSRLSVAHTEMELETFIPFTVPKKGVVEMEKLLKTLGEDDTFEIRLGQNSCSFSAAGTTITARLLEGNFPDYAKVVPRGEGTEIIAPTGEMLDLWNRMATFVEKKGVNCAVTATGLRLSVDKAEEEMEAEVRNQDEKIVNINAKYVVDACKVIRDRESARLTIRGATTPVVISTDNFYSVIMPMRAA